MMNLKNLPAGEAERIAYAEGFVGTAELFAKIADLEAEIANYQEALNLMHEQIQKLEDQQGEEVEVKVEDLL
jgi:hypothetical protein